MGGKSVFDIITDSLAYERLDRIILQDSGYVKSMEETDALAKGLKEMGLSVEETKAVNRLLCSFLTQNGLYSKLTYEQGFKDGISLLIELGTVR